MKTPKAGQAQPPQKKSSRRLLTLGIPALVIAGLALLFFWNPPLDPQTATGQPAPEFSLIDAEGQPLELRALAGKPALLYFSASWCLPCRAETRDLARLYAQYRNQFQVVWISIEPFEDSNQDLLSHRSRFGHPDFRYALDSDSLALRYHVWARGSMVLINPQGEMVFQGIRSVNNPRFVEVLRQTIGRN
jgi:peroxiredoxin